MPKDLFDRPQHQNKIKPIQIQNQSKVQFDTGHRKQFTKTITNIISILGEWMETQFIKTFPERVVKKSRIRETLNLSTDADHRTNNYFFLVKLRIFFGPPGAQWAHNCLNN